jgi:hypothetical protein
MIHPQGDIPLPFYRPFTDFLPTIYRRIFRIALPLLCFFFGILWTRRGPAQSGLWETREFGQKKVRRKGVVKVLFVRVYRGEWLRPATPHSQPQPSRWGWLQTIASHALRAMFFRLTRFSLSMLGLTLLNEKTPLLRGLLLFGGE